MDKKNSHLLGTSLAYKVVFAGKISIACNLSVEL